MRSFLFLLFLFFCQCQKNGKKGETVSYEIQTHRFVVVIASYNNEKFYEKNLASVLDQTYPHFRVIYMDDASTDHTFDRVSSWIIERKCQDKVSLIHNETRQGAMGNFYRAIQSCKDDEIIVIVDGDDWLSHEFVLEKLNAVYSNPDVWLTYGNYLTYPKYEKGECSKPVPKDIVDQNRWRSYCKNRGFTLSHLKTFYAWLFKKIDVSDLLYNGSYYPCSWDSAVMLPMAEMAGNHVRRIKEILYIYNLTNTLSDDKVHYDQQQACWMDQLKRKSYLPLRRELP